MSDTKPGRQPVEVPSLSAFSAADAANAAMNKPQKEKAPPSRAFDTDKLVEKIMRAVASDAQSKKPEFEVYVKWPRTANPHKDEIFSKFEGAGYKLSLHETPVGTALKVDYRPAE